MGLTLMLNKSYRCESHNLGYMPRCKPLTLKWVNNRYTYKWPKHLTSSSHYRTLKSCVVTLVRFERCSLLPYSFVFSRSRITRDEQRASFLRHVMLILPLSSDTSHPATLPQGPRRVRKVRPRQPHKRPQTRCHAAREESWGGGSFKRMIPLPNSIFIAAVFGCKMTGFSFLRCFTWQRLEPSLHAAGLYII